MNHVLDASKVSSQEQKKVEPETRLGPIYSTCPRSIKEVKQGIDTTTVLLKREQYALRMSSNVAPGS